MFSQRQELNQHLKMEFKIAKSATYPASFVFAETTVEVETAGKMTRVFRIAVMHKSAELTKLYQVSFSEF